MTATTTRTGVSEDVSGTVEKLHCAKPGFSAGTIYSAGRRVSFSVKGLVRQGLPVTIRGRWEVHPKWGRQFRGDEVVQTMPADADGIRAWLQHYADGFGPAKAHQAVTVYGTELPRLMATDPEQVAIEVRVPVEQVRAAALAWAKASAECNALATLLGKGLTQAEAEAVYEKWKGAAVTVLDEDPYALLGEVAGFGWARVDQLGKKLGVRADDPRRTVAAVVEVARVQFGEGSTAVPLPEGLNAAADLLGGAVPAEATRAAFDAAVAAGRVRPFGDRAFALPRPAAVESSLWRSLAAFGGPHPYFDQTHVGDREIGQFVHRGVTYTLDPTQVDAVRLTMTHRGVVVTGGAGTGKSTIACAIYRQHRAADREVAVCAPTGKAARRISETVGCTAVTIHRLLGYNPSLPGNHFAYGRDNPLPYDCVMVDEVSMCDAELLDSLLAAVRPGACVVLIGDPNQLPPVGAGFPLRDVLAHGLCPVARLETCHRQAGPLAFSSLKVLDGRVEPTDVSRDPPGWVVNDRMASVGEVLATVAFLFAGTGNRPPKLRDWGFADLFDHQFMTAKHKGPLGTAAVNELIQRLHQKSLGVELPARDPDAERLPLLAGDKVIQTRNNYDLDVMNGTLGVVVAESPLVVAFEDPAGGRREVAIPQDCRGEVSLAYCLTPHKMQGSQVPCAIVIAPKEHAFMQHRNWLYTAVTRARKTAVVFGDSLGVRRAAERVEVSTRRTLLELFATNPAVRPADATSGERGEE